MSLLWSYITMLLILMYVTVGWCKQEKKHFLNIFNIAFRGIFGLYVGKVFSELFNMGLNSLVSYPYDFCLFCLCMSESCIERCDSGFDATKQCQCDSLCKYYRSCCTDYESLCDNLSKSGIITSPSFSFLFYERKSKESQEF